MKQKTAKAGVNFINILHKAFNQVDPKSVKIQSICQHLLALLGSAGIKAARKHVGEIDPSFPSEDRGKIYKAIQLLFWPCPGKNLLRPQHKKSEKEEGNGKCRILLHAQNVI